MRPSTVPLGNAGEAAVADELVRQGYTLLARGYRFRRLGEIDLVAAKDGAVCFIEVKARSSDRFGSPADAVTPSKERRIRQVASCFLQERHLEGVEVRLLLAAVKIESSGSISCIEIVPFA